MIFKKKPKPNNMVLVQKKLLNKKLQDKKLQEKLLKFKKENQKADSSKAYVHNRNYKYYNYVFKKFTGSVIKKDLLQTMIDYEKIFKKKKINVLDDGAGKGNFLVEIKKLWEALKKEGKVKSKMDTTAVVLSKKLILKRNIDNLKVGDVSKLKLNKKYDFIFSIYGGFNYSIYEVKKEVLLKYLYSLNRGGIAIIEFAPSHLKNSILDKKFVVDVSKALKKRGFFAEFKIINAEYMGYPEYYLMVKKIK